MAENTGIAPPDFETLAGQVRVLVGDTDPTPLDPNQPGYGEYAWYSDNELEALGGLMAGSPRKVAIWVLSQVIISEALILKKWKTDDLTVDGPAIASALEKTLKRLADEVAREEMLLDDWFEVVDFATAETWRYPEGATRPVWWC